MDLLGLECEIELHLSSADQDTALVSGIIPLKLVFKARLAIFDSLDKVTTAGYGTHWRVCCDVARQPIVSPVLNFIPC